MHKRIGIYDSYAIRGSGHEDLVITFHFTPDIAEYLDTQGQDSTIGDPMSPMALATLVQAKEKELENEGVPPQDDPDYILMKQGLMELQGMIAELKYRHDQNNAPGSAPA